MFPSSGYFRGVNCPFYVSGLCERPNCHFRHSRVEEKPKPENGPNYSTSVKPYQPSTVQLFSATSLQATTYGQTKETAGYSNSAQIETAASHETGQRSIQETQPTGSSTCPIPSFSEGAQILPEPDELPLPLESLPKISGLPKPKLKGPRRSDLPSYVPTPKRVQLIVKEAVPSYNPTPKHAENRYKKTSSHTVEYDPVKNFSFREKSHSDEEDVDLTDDLATKSQKKDTLSLQCENVSASDGGNKDNCERKASAHESDLTDSDEDVSQKYDQDNPADKKLPHFAELLTPSSYFTEKLNSSVNRKLSSDSDINSSIKSAVTVQQKSSISSHKSHKHSSSKTLHKSHHSHNSHSASKSSSSSEEKGKVLKSTSLSSQKINNLGSSTPHVKPHHSVSNSEVKHSHTGKLSKSALKDTAERSLPHSSRDAKILSGSVSKKENKHKSTNLSSPSSASSSSQKKYKSHSSSLSSKNDSVSHKTNSSEASHKLKPKDLSNSQSVHKKENVVQTSKHKHSVSKLSQNGQSSQVKETVLHNGATIKKDSRNNSSLKSDSHRRSSLNGHSSSNNIKQEGKDVVHERIRNEEKNTYKRDGRDSSTVRRDSGDSSTLRRDSRDSSTVRRDSGDSSTVRRDSRDSSTVRRDSGDSSVKVLTNNHDREENNKTNPIRRTSTENCKSVTKNKISNITANLFGAESEGSGSDSDVKIVGVTGRDSGPVYNVSDSDQEMQEDNSTALHSDDAGVLSDSDTFDECLRIFEETDRRLAAKSAKAQKLGINPDSGKLRETPKVAESSDSLLLSVIKKRMAHKTAQGVARPMKKTATAVRSRLSPAEVMHNRIVEMQKRALLRAARREGRESELPLKLVDNGLPSRNKVSSKPDSPGSAVAPLSSSLSEAASSLIVSQKKREAHTPGIKTPTKSAPASSGPTWSPNSFYSKKKPEPSTSANGASDKKLVTIASTASKTEKRVAHEPTQSNLKRPVIPAEFGTKVPSNIRQRYLNLMIDEYLKFTPEEAAFIKGQEEEQAAYNRASNKNIYLRLAVNTIKRIRTEALESQPSTSKKHCLGLASLSSMASVPHPAQSHEATLGGSLAAKTSYTLHRSGNAARRLPQSFSGKELYEHLKKYILTEEQLRENGYPRPAEDGSNKVKFYKEEEKDKMLKDNERTCRRCGKRFYVDKDGGYMSLEQCVYHYANAYKKKVAGSIDSRYGCCNERIGSKGCQVAKCHVHERNKTDCLTGYMKTFPNSPSSEQNYGVYALDCEMVYTKAGIELARVTVVGDDCSVKYESLVKPDSEIIDYNTRFSGITEKDMQGVTTTLRGVQAVMLSMFCDKTILIGHSLESDLQAMKLIHSTVVDTAIVFPHRLGPPYKRALRSLMVDHLQKIIQADDGGHDSKEDAVACMQLMIYKVKNDVKRRM